MTSFTVYTFHAGNFWRYKYTVSRFNLCDTLPDLFNYRTDLMPLYKRCTGQTIPFNRITAAKTACSYLQKSLSFLRDRNRFLFDPYIFIITCPFLCPLSTYLCASTICFIGYVLSMTGFNLFFSTSSFTMMRSFVFGSGIFE